MVVTTGKPFSFDKSLQTPPKLVSIPQTILDVIVFLLVSLGYILQVSLTIVCVYIILWGAVELSMNSLSHTLFNAA